MRTDTPIKFAGCAKCWREIEFEQGAKL